MEELITFDILRPFLQADMDKLIHVNCEEIMSEILVKLDLELYSRYTLMEPWKLSGLSTSHFVELSMRNWFNWDTQSNPTIGAWLIKSSWAAHINYCGILMI